MPQSRRLSSILEEGGLWLHHRLGRLLNIGFFGQCVLIAGIAGIAILIASIADGSLVLSGRDVGLLEHPGIWSFLFLQIALLLSLRSSLRVLLQNRGDLQAIGAIDGSMIREIVEPTLKFTRLQTHNGTVTALVFHSIGLTAFVWNTYQNQFPTVILPYDFWDSKNFFWGFWVTRALKLYLFFWLFPYIALANCAILSSSLNQIRVARSEGRLKLLPYHCDGAGGLGFFPFLVTRPLIVGAFFGSISLASAFYVHQAVDVTPVMGFIILIAIVFVAYAIPIVALRKEIILTKQSMIERLRLSQQTAFSDIYDRLSPDLMSLKETDETIKCLDNFCQSINLITNYPHLKRFITWLTFATMPAVYSLLCKIFNSLIPIIQPMIKS